MKIACKGNCFIFYGCNYMRFSCCADLAFTAGICTFAADLKLNFKFGKSMTDQLISRHLAAEIRSESRFYPVLTVTGPRQSGKTTLCRAMFPGYSYYNLEDIATLELVKSDPKSFLRHCGDGVVIDEVQVYPQLLNQLMVEVDERPERRFVLTGSSNFALLESVTQSLAGRAAVFTLLPLSLGERAQWSGSVSADGLMLRGGYPRLWADRDFPAGMFYRNYYTTYVERDVRRIVNVKDLELFRKFIRLAAGRVGSEFNASSLSGEVGVSSVTVSGWLSMLAASYIGFLLPPYFENIGKRLVKTPKFYFHDTGLACFLLGIENETQLATHPLRGALFENMVVSEALKCRTNAGAEPDLYFYRDRSQHEVDLLHVAGGAISAFEIKSAQTFNADFLKGLRYLKGLYGEKVAHSAVVYDGSALPGGDDCRVVNFRQFSL